MPSLRLPPTVRLTPHLPPSPLHPHPDRRHLPRRPHPRQGSPLDQRPPDRPLLEHRPPADPLRPRPLAPQRHKRDRRLRPPPPTHLAANRTLPTHPQRPRPRPDHQQTGVAACHVYHAKHHVLTTHLHHVFYWHSSWHHHYQIFCFLRF